MALSFKKSKTNAATAPTPESDASGVSSLDSSDSTTFDVAQNGGAANGIDDGAASTRSAHKAPSGLRGSVVGLNIGADSIKAVELTGKGNSAFISALGSIPTPPDSVSDGVVMNSTALSRAIKLLFKQSGIKTRNVISSVSGTSSLVVRVIEVPRMSDNELTDNMKVDLDRYIPFAPNEVRHSFVALRELPSDPDSPNMEVLLAAARNETIDQHVDVLDDSKLRPVAIDVEPLAAARSVVYSSDSDAPLVSGDYAVATALINIGSLSTEISVLRGDIVVFTRTIPSGGNAFTQAVADSIGLATAEAEEAKRRLGDALEPLDETPAITAHAPDDWSDFGSEPNAAPANAAPASDDPFEVGFFDRGPRQEEEGEQHQQKTEGGESAPEESFGFDFDLLPSEESDGETSTPDSTSTRSGAGTQEDLDFPMQGAQVSEAAPSGQMHAFDAAEDPELPSFPTLPRPLVPSTPEEDEEELKALPTTQREEDEDEIARVEPQLEPVSFSFDSLPNVTGADSNLGESVHLPSAYEFSTPVAAPSAPAPAWTSLEADELTTPVDQTKAITSDDNSVFDLEGLVETLDLPAGGSATRADVLDPFAAPTPSTAVSPVAPSYAVDASDDFGAGILDDDFGIGFGAGLGTPGDATLDARSVYNVLHPLLADLIGEVRRSLEYYMSRYPDAPVERILLVGGGAKLRNIDAAFTQALSIPTLVANPLAHVPVKAGNGAALIGEDGPIYAVALGLALRDLV